MTTRKATWQHACRPGDECHDARLEVNCHQKREQQVCAAPVGLPFGPTVGRLAGHPLPQPLLLTKPWRRPCSWRRQPRRSHPPSWRPVGAMGVMGRVECVCV